MSKRLGLDLHLRAGCAVACSCVALLAGCALGGPDPGSNPDARACLGEAPEAKGGSNYTARLNAAKARAAYFEGCMEKRGYVLDEDKLQAELLHFEQVRNADPLGGDPMPAMRLREQQLRSDPAYWRKAAAPPPQS